MNEWPTRVRTVVAPAAVSRSGTTWDVMRLWITVGVRPAARSRSTSRSPTSAVIADGLTGSPCSSMTKQRSASPSNARPRSASCSTTAACRSRRFSGSSGLASWLGNVPSSSKYSGTMSSGSSGSPAPVPRTAGAVNPPMPLPASTTTFSGRMPDRSTRERRNEAYSASRSPSSTRPPLRGVDLGHRAGEVVAGQLAHRGQPAVLADRASAGAAELDPVVLRRVVARGEHRTGDAQRAGREVQAVRRRQADPQDVHAPGGQPVGERRHELGAGGAHVVGDDHPGAVRRPRGAPRRRRTRRRSRGRRPG